MNDHLARSRITKAMTDVSDMDFLEAESRLDAVRLAVLADSAATSTAAGQACLMTIMAAGVRTFPHITLIVERDVELIRRQPGAVTLFELAGSLGVNIRSRVDTDFTHLIATPQTKSPAAVNFRCWWDGWNSGVLPSWDLRPAGESWHPLAGAFAGALAIREVFAMVRGVKAMKMSGNVISLWEPWVPAEQAEIGASLVHLARSALLVGLGHLGQAVLWNLALLPSRDHEIVLQDHQFAGPENAPTGLLTRSSDVNRRKTRIANKWIEHFGWRTALIERKFLPGTNCATDDPAIVISALDKPEPRRDILAAQFPYMLDIGVGHGPIDFEIGQFRSFRAGDESTWTDSEAGTDVHARLRRRAYRGIDACGAFTLASASVAVPFVGATLGAICVAQLLRLGSAKQIPQLFQIELTAPEMSSRGALSRDEPSRFGSRPVDLKAPTP
ncbi:hypothetical protein [Thiomonas sp. FB-6]|uniref:hypothetical protein n=1 Tax=Thiomonas sp. FB-6 TaxID=1158291 RepID=UPI000477509F|nr:hypothetical protein [Thiomonas sp. FB-6]